MTLTAALAASALAPASAADEDHLHDRRSAVADRIDSADASVMESSKRLAAATRVLATAQAELAAAQDRLADTRGELAVAVQYDELMRQRLADAESRLASAEAELALGQRAVVAAEDRLADFVVSSVQYGDPGVVAIDTLLDGDDPSELSQGIALTDSVLGVQITSVDDLEAAKTLLAIREREVQAIRDEVELRREQAAAELARRRALEQRAETETQAVAGLVAERADAAREAAQARKADIAQLRALEAERERISAQLRRIAEREAARAAARAAAERAAAERAAERAAAERAAAERAAAERAAAEAAAAERVAAEATAAERAATPSIAYAGNGFLSAPVTASITSSYGMRMHPVLGVLKLHDGTDFGVGCGTPVQAAAAGEVVSAYGSAGYGNQLVVNHGTVDGRGVATSYAHLTSFAASLGEHVERGEVIGWSGDTGYSSGCHLHFMVYVDGTPVDPLGWL